MQHSGTFCTQFTIQHRVNRIHMQIYISRVNGSSARGCYTDFKCPVIFFLLPLILKFTCGGRGMNLCRYTRRSQCGLQSMTSNGHCHWYGHWQRSTFQLVPQKPSALYIVSRHRTRHQLLSIVTRE